MVHRLSNKFRSNSPKIAKLLYRHVNQLWPIAQESCGPFIHYTPSSSTHSCRYCLRVCHFPEIYFHSIKTCTCVRAACTVTASARKNRHRVLCSLPKARGAEPHPAPPIKDEAAGLPPWLHRDNYWSIISHRSVQKVSNSLARSWKYCTCIQVYSIHSIQTPASPTRSRAKWLTPRCSTPQHHSVPKGPDTFFFF